MSADHGLVTPEAVPLDLPVAAAGSRGAAVLVDWLIQALVLFALALGLQFVEFSGFGSAGITIVLIVSFLVLFGYPVGFETVTRGRTPGKALFGLRVVTAEGGPVGFRHAAIRAALGTVDFAATSGVAAVVSSLLSPRNQRLGDHVAGTVVLRERIPTAAVTAQTFTVPESARAVADSIDTAGLTARDYAAVRAFLLRADGLDPERRDALADRLLETIRPRLGVVPTAQLPARTWLQVVAARYQQRVRTPAADVG